MRRPGRFLRLAAMATLVVAFAPGLSRADLSYSFTTEFSGATAPVGPGPWITATFAAVDANTVKLTIDTSGLTGSEFIDAIYFNVADAKVGLTASYVSGNNPVAIDISMDAYKADGDGKYDIRLTYDNAPPSDRFGAGETSVIQLTYAGGLVPDDFKFLSAPDGGNGPFYAAAHVQGIGPNGDDSGWVAPKGPNPPPIPPVPEPSSLAIAGLSVLGLVGYGLRRRSK